MNQNIKQFDDDSGISAPSRRDFLKLMSASLALAGMAGCTRRPEQKIVPYVVPPEQLIPGRALHFASTMPFGGYGLGVLVESHEGRPTKIEGNPNHPASLGGTNVFMQASVLMLYDPDRASVVTERGVISDWGRLLAGIRPHMEKLRENGGAGLRILTETVTSPTMVEQMRQLKKIFPASQWHWHDPVGRQGVYEGARRAFGRAVNPIWRLDRARVIVSIDGDFLFAEPGSVRYAREFIGRRLVREGKLEMNRLYVIESTPSITGSMADHRLVVRPSEIEEVAGALAAMVGGDGGAVAKRWPGLVGMAEDLRRHRGEGLVLAGASQGAAVHAMAYAMNQALGNRDTVMFTEPVEGNLAEGGSLRELVDDMQAGKVDALIIMGGNPVYTAPADVPFGQAMLDLSRDVDSHGVARRFTAHLSLYNDETSFLCQWHVPQTHYLETWGDVRAFDGTASIIQPLIAPLYQPAKSEHEMLAMLMGEHDLTTYEIVRDYWRARSRGNFEDFWQETLERGVVANSALPAVGVSMKSQVRSVAPATSVTTKDAGMEIVFRPDPSIWDGSFANVGWQQELPKPFTKLTWDNACLMSSATARKIGVNDGDVVKVTNHGKAVRAPVLIVPGQADDTLTVHLGYGRTRVGQIGTDVGFNAYALQRAEHLWQDEEVEIVRTGQRHQLAVTHSHHAMGQHPPIIKQTDMPTLENRNLVRTGTLEEFRRNPKFFQEMEGTERPLRSLFPEYRYEGYKWGMVVDMTACIGCNACVVACQAENNTPVVGKDQVLRGREMHWLRIDDYRGGNEEAIRFDHQPILCMHCETAPCELVCPVGATVHDAEGINNMVYNRCVGTRYCSNNCPYKVRRFNFYYYSDYVNPTIKMQKNPNVTVRSRGVMEKCTYCIQRIAAARIDAEKEGRTIGDGEIQTACQQACPTRAIIFGNLNDPNAQVTRLAQSPLDYGLLTELTTLPRTTYLARVWNPGKRGED